MAYDPLDLRAQEKQRRETGQRARVENENEESDFKWLMTSKRGRRLVWRLMDQAGVFRLSFSLNALQMAFAEGNRNYGNRVLALLNEHCPELYATMVKEQIDGRVPDDGTRNAN